MTIPRRSKKFFSLCSLFSLLFLGILKTQSYMTYNYLGLHLGFTYDRQQLISDITNVPLFGEESFFEFVDVYDEKFDAKSFPADKSIVGIKPIDQINIFQDLSYFSPQETESQFCFKISVEKEWYLDNGVAFKGAACFLRIIGPREKSFTFDTNVSNSILMTKVDSNNVAQKTDDEYMGYKTQNNEVTMNPTWGWNVYGGFGFYTEDFAFFVNIGFASERNTATLEVDPYVTYGEALEEVEGPIPTDVEHKFFRNGLLLGFDLTLFVNRFADMTLGFHKIFYYKRSIAFDVAQGDGEPLTASDYYVEYPSVTSYADVEPDIRNNYEENVFMKSSMERTLMTLGFRFKTGMQEDY